MTHRTESNPPTPIECATNDVVQAIRNNALHFHREYAVLPEQHIDERAFLKILALYLHDRTLQDWCKDLGIPEALDPANKPYYGGQA